MKSSTSTALSFLYIVFAACGVVSLPLVKAADRASGAALRGTQALAYNPTMQYGNENMRLAPGSMPAAPVVMRPVVAPLIQGTFWRVHNGLAAASNSLLGTEIPYAAPLGRISGPYPAPVAPQQQQMVASLTNSAVQDASRPGAPPNWLSSIYSNAADPVAVVMNAIASQGYAPQANPWEAPGVLLPNGQYFAETRGTIPYSGPSNSPGGWPGAYPS